MRGGVEVLASCGDPRDRCRARAGGVDRTARPGDLIVPALRAGRAGDRAATAGVPRARRRHRAEVRRGGRQPGQPVKLVRSVQFSRFRTLNRIIIPTWSVRTRQAPAKPTKDRSTPPTWRSSRTPAGGLCGSTSTIRSSAPAARCSTTAAAGRSNGRVPRLVQPQPPSVAGLCKRLAPGFLDDLRDALAEHEVRYLFIGKGAAIIQGFVGTAERLPTIPRPREQNARHAPAGRRPARPSRQR